MPGERGARMARFPLQLRGRHTSERARGREADERPRQGGARATEARAVSEGVNAPRVGEALRVPPRDHLPSRRVVLVATAERPREFVRGLEAIAEANGVDLETRSARGFRHRCRAD